MIEVVNEGHSVLIRSLFERANSRIRIISPFLSRKTAELLCKAAQCGIECSFITRFYLQDFIDGSNSIEGLQQMLDAGVKLYALVALHTKLYLFDSDDAIVGSANFTNGGLYRNVELSLHLNKEDAVIKELIDYYEELQSEVEQNPEGLITQDMLDDIKARFDEQKERKKYPGSSNYVVFIRGATLDKNAKRIKEFAGEALNELEKHIDERKNDMVFVTMGGNKDKINYKTPQNIILKFSGSSKRRANGKEPMYMKPFTDEKRNIFITNFSEAKKNSAKTVENGDETFFCVHSYDIDGKACPLIVGKGILRRYDSSNDARKKGWATNDSSLAEYPIYCEISEARIIDAPIQNGIPLRELTETLGYKTYMHTREHPEKYPREKVAKAHGQQAMLMLSPEAKEYLDRKLDELGERYGWISYKSDEII